MEGEKKKKHKRLKVRMNYLDLKLFRCQNEKIIIQTGKGRAGSGFFASPLHNRVAVITS
jgi:hypothetical protein